MPEKNIILLVGLCLLIMICGCNSSASNSEEGCKSDSDCDSDHICNNGECEAACSRDSDCPSGKWCRSGKCVSIDDPVDGDNTTVTDGDLIDGDSDSGNCSPPCSEGQYCDDTTGLCVEGCAANDDCPALNFCDTARHECYFVGCMTDHDCTGGKHCRRATGECLECSEDFHCTGGICNMNTNTCVNSSCNDDPKEPNDVSENAVAIADGKLSKLTLCPPDEDWFRFMAAAGDMVRLVIESDGMLDGEVIHADGGEAVFSGSSNSSPWQIDIGRLDWGGEYWLKLSGGGTDPVSYGIELNAVTETSSCEDDVLEENDGQTSAFRADASSYENLMICPGDPDWYAFSLDAGQSLAVDINVKSQSDIPELALYDPSLRRVASGDGAKINLPYAGVSGEFFLRVRGQDSASEWGYGMDIEIGNAPNQCSDDNYENNDASSYASELTPNGEINAVLCPGDPDWFAIRLNGGDTLQANLLADDQTIDMAVLAPESGAQLQTARNEDGMLSLSFLAPAAGTYFMRISGSSDSDRTTYTLSFQVEEAAPCDDDHLEPNDEPAEAVQLNDNFFEDLYLCPGNEDWYYVELPAGYAVDTHLLFDHAEGDLDLYMFDPYGELAAMSTSTSDDEFVTVGPYDMDVYIFFAVVGWENAQNFYILDVSLVSVAGDCRDDEYEENDTRLTAARIEEGDYSLIMCRDDMDYLEVRVADGGALLAEISFDASAADLDLYLLDSTGYRVDASESQTSRESVSLDEAPWESLYYLLIMSYESFTDDRVPYDLELLVDAP